MMTQPAGASEGHGHHAVSPISVPWVVVASVLCGLGLLLLWMWLTTFQWIWFSGVIPILVGGLMFFNDRAGLDHA
jgi:hypothetical protein